MSGYLWKFFFEDDFESFHQLLTEAGVASRPPVQKTHISAQNHGAAVTVGSPEALATSPPGIGKLRGETASIASTFSNVTLTRADLNRKDTKGLTLLHHIASSTGESATNFALLLVTHPLIDLYIQDLENGWTPLHRAFYFGNIGIARAIVEREYQDNLGHGNIGSNTHSVPLIKIKDREGNGPYDILTATIHDRTLRHHGMDARVTRMSESDDEDGMNDFTYDDDQDSKRRGLVYPSVNVQGDELFTFGSNKNITLGLGNEDDRQFPEKISLKRPDHLYRKFYREYVDEKASRAARFHGGYAERVRANAWVDKDVSSFPAIIRACPITIQDVQMSKYHSAIITNDPVSNLYVCGHGLGGRLGTGSEKTQFKFACIEDFGSKRKKIVAVALGQDHTLAITDQGELFTWGSNTYGQLGHGLSKTNITAEEPIQLLPKQLFGPLKREIIVGVAASRIHSVTHTTQALYTFGKNEGQLGIVDAHAGSLEIQPIPRRVAASRFSCAIQQVSAIDRATVCLLENHEVHVLANYGIVKLQFALDGFTNYFLKKSFLATRYDDTPNQICKITCGGDTICALSTAGEIFAVTVDQRLDPGSSSTTSTTNPNKIRAALSNPSRIWSLKKGHMNARDVGVDQDGSIILTTEAGSVWRRVRRAGLANSRQAKSLDKKLQAFKFSRVPGLTRVTAVRASGSGAYCAIRQDCDVTKSQISVGEQNIWNDIYALLPFRNLVGEDESDKQNTDCFQRMTTALLKSRDLEKDITGILNTKPNQNGANFDAYICSSLSNVRIPIHQFLLAGRSRYMIDALSKYRRDSSFSDELISIGEDDSGGCLVTVQGVDFLTILEFVLYVYTDVFVGFWLHARHAPHLAFRYRQVRLELMRLGSKLEMRNLEAAVRKMTPSAEMCLDKDLELAFMNPEFFVGGDAKIQLSDGEMLVHSDLMSRRCPFFQGLFQGRTGGRWLADRRYASAGVEGAVGVDMTHVDCNVFRLVLRYLYADTGEELFDSIVSQDLDEFLDIVMDVLSVANELMLDRLSEICQSVIGRYVNVRNVCQLLNAIGPASVHEFKDSGLEYVCLNLEAALTNHLLEELDEDLMQELDTVVRDNQFASITGMAQVQLLEKHPELPEVVELDRQRKIDAINMQIKYGEGNLPIGVSFELREDKQQTNKAGTPSNPTTPLMKPKSPHIGTEFGPTSVGRAPHGLSSPQFEALNPSSPASMAMSVSPGLGKSMLDGNATASRYESVLASPAPRDVESLSPMTVKEVLNTSVASAATSRSTSTTQPWGSSPISSEKFGMKDIMDQAQASRTSNISLGLASSAKAEGHSSGSFNSGKLSQKERRKQQQRQQSTPLINMPTQAPPSPSPSSKSAPWQTITSNKKITEQVSQSIDPLPGQSLKPPAQRAVTTPQLTMRQTVANSPAQGKQKTLPETPQTSSQKSGGHTPESSKSPQSNQSSSSTSASKPIEIKSIRHQPRPTNEVSPTFRMHQSMADILSQQEAEKRVIKEATAKVSLQDIQQEQEFLTWWDNESKKVMEEEEAARAASTRGRGKGRSSSRGRGRRGRGRGKERANSSTE